MIKPPRATAPIVVVIAAVTVLVGWGARRWVEERLPPGVPVEIAGDVLRLTRGENTGVALGLLRDLPLVPWLSLLALIAVGVVLARAVQHRPAVAVALGLIVGGGLTNLIDRLGDGRVTDYIDVGLGAWRYPTFNLPDSAIVVGLALAAWLLGQSARFSPAPQTAEPAESSR